MGQVALWLVGVVMLVGPFGDARVGGQPADGWPLVGRDPAHGGTADGPAPPYEVAWEADIEAGPIAGPVVDGGLLVVLAREHVVALDPASGQERWMVDRLPGPGEDDPDGGDGAGPAALTAVAAVFAEGDGGDSAVRAVSREDGSDLWRTESGSAVRGGVTVAEDRVLVGTRRGLVLALDAESGEELWRFEALGRVDSVPAVADGLVFVTSQDLDARRGAVYSLDLDSGEEQWRFEPEGNVAGFSSAAVSGGTVFVGTGDLRARALDARTGEERWDTRVRAPFSPRLVPAVPGDLVIGDALGDVYLLDADTGDERWVFRLPGLLVFGSPAVAGGAVVVGDGSGQASAIDLSSGLLVWKETFGDERLGAPALAGGRVYLASRGGRVIALDPDPGGPLLQESSPTTLFVGRALVNYVAAFALVAGFLLGLFRLVWGRRATTVEDGQ